MAMSEDTMDLIRVEASSDVSKAQMAMSESSEVSNSKSVKGGRGFASHTAESRAKISEALRGRPRTRAHNKAISDGWRRRLENGGETPHGSPSRYKYGCRCDECRTAWREYKRARSAVRS